MAYVRQCTRIGVEKMQDITDCVANRVVARKDEEPGLTGGECTEAGIEFVTRKTGVWIQGLVFGHVTLEI